MKSEAEISTKKIAFTENLSVFLNIRFLEISKKSVNIYNIKIVKDMFHASTDRKVECSAEYLNFFLKLE